jgi:type I restriction enzyme, S subunit
MSEWKEYKLKDLGLLQRGRSRHRPRYAFHLYGGKYPFIQTGQIREASKYITKYEQTYSEEGLKQSKLWPKGTLCITIAANIAELAILDFDACFPDSVLGFIPDKKIADLDFIFYTLTHFQRELKHIGEGSVQDNINLGTFEDLLFPIPPLPEQTAIASVLSSLDDKIDLLHRQNATLEKMAETLFRQWFVEEAKEEWEEIKLGSIVEIINGVSYKSDDLNPSATAMVTLKSFERNGGFRMDGFKEYTGKYKEQHILKEGDLVVAHTDITQEADVIGNPVMVIGNPKYDTLIFSMDLVKVVSKSNNYSNEFLYLLMKSREFKEHCLGYSNGSTVLHLSKKAVPEYEMKLPPDNLINEFSKKVKPLVQKQFRNQTQIRTLTSLRDNLLPKLMSGEVTVEI